MGCLLFGATLSFVLYRKDKKLKEFPKWLIPILAFFRFTSISIIAILLLAPLIKYYSKNVEEPIIVFASDNSASIIQTKDSSFIQTEFEENKKVLLQKLENTFRVDQYFFGENIKEAKGKPDYSEKVTDISNFFDDIETRYINTNVGAIVLLSDGIVNQGNNPLYTQKKTVPVYTVALGDTVSHTDLSINRVENNKVAFLGNDFPIEIDLKSVKAAGKSTKVSIFKAGIEVFTELITLTSNLETKVIKTNLTASNKGLQRYTVIVNSIEGEFNILNNEKDFYIDVIDGRQRILLLTEAPHPDINAIKAAIKNNANYELVVSNTEEFKGEIADYNLILFYQIPSTKSNSKWLDQAIEQRVATLHFVGNSSSIFELNNLNLGLRIDSKSTSNNEVMATINLGFPLFKLSEKTELSIEKFPPLISPFGKYIQTGQNFVLLNQKIGLVKTQNPLLNFLETDGLKHGLLLGEGLWRWRMADFAENGNHNASNELILKTIQYLAVKADKSYFRISHAESFYENESIRIEAQLYNKSYELTTEPEINILFTDTEGIEYPYSFNKKENTYFLNIPDLPVGNYNYKSKVLFGSKELIEEGQFSIKRIQLEEAQTIANHNLLYQLAEKSDGKMFYPSNISGLFDEINSREDIASISYQEEEIEDVINLKWIFFLLLSLLSIEWFLRKQGGAY
jgi:hypothetical protein